MVSAWTVALAYQTFRQLSEICRRAGEDARARRLDGGLERGDGGERRPREGLQHVHARGWRVPAEELSALLGPERNLVEIDGVVVRPPGDAPLRAVVVNGRPITRFTAAQATVEELPAKVRLIR